MCAPKNELGSSALSFCGKHVRRNRSAIALLLLLVAEVLVVLWFHGLLPSMLTVVGCVCLVGLMSVVFWRSFKAGAIKSSFPRILTKLLSNAIVPSGWGVCYLLFFVMHISWATDGLLGVITTADPASWLSLGIGAVGLLLLLIFFPEGRKAKQPHPIKVFVSGMSALKVPWNNDYRNLNLRPLVRVLQTVADEDEGRCEMLILRSDQKNDIAPLLDFLKIDEETARGLSNDGKLERLIREVAKREFPDKKWIDKMQITFTHGCNYNDFVECSEELIPRIKHLDDERHQLIFNLTPGTAVVSSLMTLLAIDANRELYYYNQNDQMPDNERLASVDKSQISWDNLLTQALESLDAGK